MRSLIAAALALLASPAFAGNGQLVAGTNTIHAPGASFGFSGWLKLVDMTPDADQYIFGTSIYGGDNGIRMAYSTNGSLLLSIDRAGSTLIWVVDDGGRLSPGWTWLVVSYNDTKGQMVTCINKDCRATRFHLTGANPDRSARSLYFAGDGMGNNGPTDGNKVTDGLFYLDPDTVPVHETHGRIVMKAGGLSLDDAEALTAANVK